MTIFSSYVKLPEGMFAISVLMLISIIVFCFIVSLFAVGFAIQDRSGRADEGMALSTQNTFV